MEWCGNKAPIDDESTILPTSRQVKHSDEEREEQQATSVYVSRNSIYYHTTRASNLATDVGLASIFLIGVYE